MRLKCDDLDIKKKRNLWLYELKLGVHNDTRKNSPHKA